MRSYTYVFNLPILNPPAPWNALNRQFFIRVHSTLRRFSLHADKCHEKIRFVTVKTYFIPTNRNKKYNLFLHNAYCRVGKKRFLMEDEKTTSNRAISGLPTDMITRHGQTQNIFAHNNIINVIIIIIIILSLNISIIVMSGAFYKT